MKPGKNNSKDAPAYRGKMREKPVQNLRAGLPVETKPQNAFNGANGAIKSPNSVQKIFVKAMRSAAALPRTRLSPSDLVPQTLPRESPFFSLPGELRTKIYEYIFDTYRVAIIRHKPPAFEGQKQGRYRLYHKNLQLRDEGSHAINSTMSASPPLALALTCSKLYLETVLYLYSNTHFVFSSPKVINMFLKRTAKVSQAAIRHLELHHIMYNEPALTEHRIYKCLSDMRWYLTCGDMCEAFTSLKTLHLNLAIADWPIRLEVEEKWALPLKFFRDLDYADVKLHMGMFKEEKLQKVARKLEEQMMKPEAFQIKNDERIARELMAKMGPVKARKVLTITL